MPRKFSEKEASYFRQRDSQFFYEDPKLLSNPFSRSHLLAHRRCHLSIYAVLIVAALLAITLGSVRSSSRFKSEKVTTTSSDHLYENKFALASAFKLDSSSIMAYTLAVPDNTGYLTASETRQSVSTRTYMPSTVSSAIATGHPIADVPSSIVYITVVKYISSTSAYTSLTSSSTATGSTSTATSHAKGEAHTVTIYDLPSVTAEPVKATTGAAAALYPAKYTRIL